MRRNLACATAMLAVLGLMRAAGAAEPSGFIPTEQAGYGGFGLAISVADCRTEPAFFRMCSETAAALPPHPAERALLQQRVAQARTELMQSAPIIARRSRSPGEMATGATPRGPEDQALMQRLEAQARAELMQSATAK